MVRASAICFLSVLVSVHAAIDYSSVLQGLFTQSDKDGDSELNLEEFKVAAGKLGVEASIFTLHGKSYDQFFAACDADGNGKMTRKELAGAIRPEWEAYKKPLIAAFTNDATTAPTALPTASAGIKNAVATVNAKVTVGGKPSDIYPGQRKAIIKYFADLGKVTPDEVLATFLLKKSGGGRRLATAETIVDAKIFVKSDADARQLAQALPKDKDAMQKVAAFDGLEVKAAPQVVARPQWQVPFVSMGGMIVGLLVASILTCFIGKCWARRNREIVRVQYDGCCSTGCCSFLAVRSWAFWQLFACVVLAACVVFMMIRMQGLTKVLQNLVDIFQKLLQSTVSFISKFQQQVPSFVNQQVNQFKQYIPLLPIAVIVPGVLACLCLFFSGACPMGKCHVGRYGCTKFFIIIGNIWLIVALVFYMIFAVIALALKYAPPNILAQINSALSMCEVIPPMIKQKLGDSQSALDVLKSAGQDTSQYDKTLKDIVVLSDLADAGCENILQMFEEFNLLFLPGALCVTACFFGLYTSNALCCAAGCCFSDQRKLKELEDGDKDKKGVEFTNMNQTSAAAGFSAAA